MLPPSGPVQVVVLYSENEEDFYSSGAWLATSSVVPLRTNGTATSARAHRASRGAVRATGGGRERGDREI